MIGKDEEDQTNSQGEPALLQEGYDYSPQVLTSYDESLASTQLRAFLSPAQLPILMVALVTAVNGLVAVFSPVAERLLEHPKLFDVLVPYGVNHWSRSLSVGIGFVLINLAWNLFQRKRISWILSVILLTGSLLLHLARAMMESAAGDGNIASNLIAAGAVPPVIDLALLWFYRSRFCVRSEPRWRGSIMTAAIVFAVAAAYGAVGFFLLDRRDFGVDFRFGDALVRSLRQLLLIGNADLVPHSNHGQWFLDSLNTAGGVALVLALYGLFRPIEYDLRTRPVERKKVAEILEEHGKDALDNYKLLDDKSYAFSASGNSCIAYTTTLDTAISLGDPVGHPAELETFTRSFVAACHTNGWSVAFMQTSDSLLEMYKRLGLQVLKVGEDAIVDLEKFATETIKKKDFKSSRKKFEKAGYDLVCLKPPHSNDVLNAVESVSNQWLSIAGRRERGFSLGQFDRAEVAQETLYVLKNESGKIVAFVNQVRSYAPGEVSIDMMRYMNDVPSGTMDFLFLRLLLALKEEGFKTFSLGLAALSGVGEEADASLEEKAVHMIYEHMNRFFSYKGLRHYKSKFSPEWQERFLIYEGGPPGLLKTAMAILKATEA